MSENGSKLTDLSSEPVAMNLAQGLKVADTEWDWLWWLVNLHTHLTGGGGGGIKGATASSCP